MLSYWDRVERREVCVESKVSRILLLLSSFDMSLPLLVKKTFKTGGVTAVFETLMSSF